jgi:hypothetical protein
MFVKQKEWKIRLAPRARVSYGSHLHLILEETKSVAASAQVARPAASD